MSSISQETPIPRDDISPTRASFYDLPNELVLDIVSQIHTRHGLRTLRLFSRVLNEMVKDRVTDRLSLVGDLAVVETMLSTPNTFDRSCGTLRIEYHDYPDDHYGWVVLAKLVGKMKGLHTVKWVVEQSIDSQLLSSISRLPLLQNLALEFRSTPRKLGRLMMLPKSTASKLKSLSIEFHAFGWDSYQLWDYPDAKAAICYLVANAPALEHLHIGKVDARYHGSDAMFGPPMRGTPLNLDALFAHLRSRPSFQPSLRIVSPMAIKFPTTPGAIGFFAKLSTLRVSNHLREHERLWPAMHASGIRLAEIAVQWLSPQLTQYLQGYHGLRVFHLDILAPNERYVLDQDIQSLWTHALPGHQTTLTDLRFCPSQDRAVDKRAADRRPSTVLWDIPAILAHLQPFDRIERLDLIHYAVDMTSKTQRDSLTSNIAAIVCHNSRNLKSVRLDFIGLDRTVERYHPSTVHPVQNFLRMMAYIGEGLKVERQPSANWRQLNIVMGIPKELRLPMKGHPFPIHRFAHYIVCEGKDVYGLREDSDATQLLNEPGTDADHGEL